MLSANAQFGASFLQIDSITSATLGFEFPVKGNDPSIERISEKAFSADRIVQIESKGRLDTLFRAEAGQGGGKPTLKLVNDRPNGTWSRVILDTSELFAVVDAEYHDIRFDIEIEVVSRSEADLRADWLAVLYRDQQGGYEFYQHVERELRLSPGRNSRQWQIALAKRPNDDVFPLFLVLQLPNLKYDLEIEKVSVQLRSLSSGHAGLATMPTGVARGWSKLPAGELSVQARDVKSGTFRVINTPETARFETQVPDWAHSATASPTIAAANGKGEVLALYAAGTASELEAPPAERKGAPRPAGAMATLRELYTEKNHEELFKLYDDRGLDDLDRPVETVEEASVLYYTSRSLLDMNAANSGYLGLSRLVQQPAFDEFEVDERRRIWKLIVRAALRSGRAPEAKQILDEQRLQHPTDWEIYFQLANLEQDPARKLFYFRLAERLINRVPFPHMMVIIEAMLEAGQIDDALTACLEGMKRAKKGEAPQLALVLANIYLASGDRKGWQFSLQSYFRELGLSAPEFDTSIDNEHDIFHTVRSETQRGGTVEGKELVTVVMTSWNAAETIEVAMRSVLAQTWRNLRLVVVDDVSEDSSVEVARRIAAEDSRVVVLANNTNVGTYCSKNSAVSLFDSDFYAFHDSDDWMHPERIERHMEVMRNEPTCATSFSQWFRMDQRGYAMVRKAGGYLHDNPASTFFRREVIREVGYFDSVRTGADSEMLWRVRRRFGRASVKTMPLPLAIGLHHSASLTQTGATAFDEHRFSHTRMTYWESWVRWHRNNVLQGGKPLYIPFPLAERAFEAPEEIAVSGNAGPIST